MVKIEITTAKVGKIENELNVQINGSVMSVFATMIELERGVAKVITEMETKTGLNLSTGFLENLMESLDCELSDFEE